MRGDEGGERVEGGRCMEEGKVDRVEGVDGGRMEG